MRLLVTLIAVAAFGLHILLGCCAHHAHVAAQGVCALTSSCSDDADHPCHSHGHDHSAPDSNTPPHSNAPPGDHSHNDCHESHCTFIAAGKTIVAVDLLVADLPAVATDAAIDEAATASYRWIGDTGDHPALPVRLHLFHQVLLI